MKIFIINVITFLITQFIYKKLFDNQANLNIKKIFSIVLLFILTSLLTYYIGPKTNHKILISIFTNITILTLFNRILYGFKPDYSISFKNIIKYLMFGITFAFSLEIFLFNFRHFESLNYKEIELNEITAMEGLKEVEKNIYTVDKKDRYYFEITNINEKIKNINLVLENILDEEDVFDIKLGITDEANLEYLNIPSFNYSKKVPTSYIHRLHLSGKSNKILIGLNLDEKGLYKINEISINKKVPLIIEWSRFIVVLLVILLFFFFRPNSALYNIKAIDYKKTMPIIMTFIILEMFLFMIIVNLNPSFYQTLAEHHDQYNMLAKSFTKGQLNIDFPENETLLNMDNPYDTNQRYLLDLKGDIDYLWDTSFYNGKYYVYFGVVPVLTFYLPHYLITGKYVSNQVVVATIGILTMLTCIYFIYQIIKRWFKKTSIATFLIITTLFISSSGMLYIMKRPDLYSVPIIYSLLFTTLGLGLWIQAYNEKKKNLNLLKIFSGSLCMALVAGCRPQFILGSFFIIPLFYQYLFKDKWNKRKTYEIIILLLPYIIVAIPLMIYNYLRFGSIFDFGANYNLTTNDMTKRGFVPARIITGLYYYLICPTNISVIFPFIEGIAVKTTYLGLTISEVMFGGFFYNNLICLISLFVTKFKNLFKEKSLYYISLLSVIFGFIVIIADTEMAGILPRYYSDFSWLFLLSAIIIILVLNEKYSNKTWFKKALIFLVVIAIIYNFTFILVDTELSIAEEVPTLFERIRYLIMFWS